MADLAQHLTQGAFRGRTKDFRSGSRPSVALSRAPHAALVHGLDGIANTVEADIIPRLVLAHRVSPAVGTAPLEDAASPFPDDVVRFAELVLNGHLDAASARVDELRALGTPLEAVYLRLLAPTAGYLRHLWREDLCDFAEEALALWRLQQILRDFSTAFRSGSAHLETGRRVLLVPSPGEKPELPYLMFGLVLVGEFFRRDGWDSWIEPDPTSREFMSTVRNQWFDVVEFLVNGDKHLDAIASSIRTIRRESPNRGLGVMLCGRAFVEHPELVLMVGGDIASSDPRQGTSQAHNLVGLLASRG